MSFIEIAFLALVFLSVFGVVVVSMVYFAPSIERQRLHRLVPNSPGATPASDAWLDRVARLAGRFGKLSVPEEGWEESGLRIRFMNAGLRSASAPLLYLGMKTTLAIGLPLLVFLYLTVIATGATPDDEREYGVEGGGERSRKFLAA